MYPDEHEAFLQTMAQVNFNVSSMLSSPCLLTIGLYDQLVLSTVTPPVTRLACVGTFFTSKMNNQHWAYCKTQALVGQSFCRVSRVFFSLFLNLPDVRLRLCRRW